MASSSSAYMQQNHQVFFRFRGEDTRCNFTSHLYEGLQRRGIDCFIDNQLERGENISTALRKAIEGSKISVVVVSKNYVSLSCWLGQLYKIIKCSERCGQKVVPIFYDLNLSDVQKQTGNFAEAFAEHVKNRADKVEKWRAALHKVGCLRVFRLHGQQNDGNGFNTVLHEIWEEVYSALLTSLFSDDKYEDLGRMYSLFRHDPNGLILMRDVMTSYIRDTGKQLVTDPQKLKDPVDFVQRLLDLKDKHAKIINLAFHNDKTFQNALKSSFEYFINLNSQSPEFISLFMDDKLRKGLRGSDKDIELILDKVMRLFRYLPKKDVFEKYYKKHFAKRLLSGEALCDDVERRFIDKLKTECGDQFTSRLEGMFTDTIKSRDRMNGFYASLGADLGDSPKLAVQILTTAYWSTQPRATCNLPEELLGICKKFWSYLGTPTSWRVSSWQTNMGRAVLKATLGNGQQHELNVSTYQMCVLMLFNNADRLGYNDIEQATQIPASDLKRCLQSLACVKGKNVLRKEPMSKDIAEDDAFFFNEKFTSKFFKVKIGTVVTQWESEPENQETRQRVEAWKYPIDAAIVRIMKSRRVLDHNNLVAEVTKQLQSRFLLNPVEFKKRIECLIEREFLERDKVDRKLYQYIL